MKNIKILLPLLLLVAFGCKKHNAPVNNNVASLSDFPLANGNTWTYQVDDSVTHTTYNATFTIIANYMINGPAVYYTTQTMVNGTVVDSGLIISNADSVIYQPNGQGLFSTVTLLFPLTPNNYWHTRYGGDSVFVIAADISHNVLGTNYDSVYNVGRRQWVPDLYITQNLFIAPHVGIIEETLDITPWIPVHKTLRLVSYQLH